MKNLILFCLIFISSSAFAIKFDVANEVQDKDGTPIRRIQGSSFLVGKEGDQTVFYQGPNSVSEASVEQLLALGDRMTLAIATGKVQVKDDGTFAYGEGFKKSFRPNMRYDEVVKALGDKANNEKYTDSLAVVEKLERQLKWCSDHLPKSQTKGGPFGNPPGPKSAAPVNR